jgi:hypothetical protein
VATRVYSLVRWWGLLFPAAVAVWTRLPRPPHCQIQAGHAALTQDVVGQTPWSSTVRQIGLAHTEPGRGSSAAAARDVGVDDDDSDDATR